MGGGGNHGDGGGGSRRDGFPPALGKWAGHRRMQGALSTCSSARLPPSPSAAEDENEKAGVEGVYCQGGAGLSGGVYLLATRSSTGRGRRPAAPWAHAVLGQRHFLPGPGSHPTPEVKVQLGARGGGMGVTEMSAPAPTLQCLRLSQGRPSPTGGRPPSAPHLPLGEDGAS